MGIRNYRKFHEESQAAWDAQCRRLAKAVEQCDHIATPQEIADALAVVASDPQSKQPDILGDA